jgi:hypothetical protein
MRREKEEKDEKRKEKSKKAKRATEARSRSPSTAYDRSSWWHPSDWSWNSRWSWNEDPSSSNYPDVVQTSTSSSSSSSTAQGGVASSSSSSSTAQGGVVSSSSSSSTGQGGTAFSCSTSGPMQGATVPSSSADPDQALGSSADPDQVQGHAIGQNWWRIKSRTTASVYYLDLATWIQCLVEPFPYQPQGWRLVSWNHLLLLHEQMRLHCRLEEQHWVVQQRQQTNPELQTRSGGPLPQLPQLSHSLPASSSSQPVGELLRIPLQQTRTWYATLFKPQPQPSQSSGWRCHQCETYNYSFRAVCNKCGRR